MASKENKRRRGRKVLPAIPKALNEQLLEQASKSKDQILEDLHTSVNGLTIEQYEKNKEQFGANTFGARKQHRWYHSLINAFLNPFSLVLIVIAIISFIVNKNPTERYASSGIILAILLVTCFTKIFQELRSSKASERLREMIKTTAAVERNGIKNETPIEEIVPGDIIHLAAGDMVPADLLVLNAKDLFVTQSALTGESEPVEKIANWSQARAQTALESNNLCFMGTSVSSGSAQAVVLNIGSNTFFGQIARSITKRRPKTNFDKGIHAVSILLLCTTLIMTVLVFVLNTSITHDVWTALTFALALAVGLTPELLPMIVTVNLAKEAFRLSKQKTIVKNINSIQSFGAMDILCTDKTGTLTEDRIVLERHLNVEGKEDNRVLIYGYLNSHFQTGLKNLLDLAIIDKAKSVNYDQYLTQFKKIDEIPFDFQRRRMSVVLKDTTGKSQIITKGALEEIVSICEYAEYKGTVIKIDQKLKEEVMSVAASLNEQGMRVIAIATNTKPLPTDRPFSVQDESGMKLVGYVALLDPPKLSAKKAILDLQRRGVRVKVLTGDNEAVAKYICSRVGIKGKRILRGSDIEDMSQDALKDQVMNVDIFAKLSPEQKSRVVEAIKLNRHVVGFMGDGINDAAAMRVADISISVNNAVDIAKESADIILMEKDLTILGHGCVEGRKTYANIIKYIKMTVSSNFGNMLSMLVATIWLTQGSDPIGIPMRPEQILILNLVYDFAQLALPWDNVDSDFYNKPRSWNARSILKFMLFIGPISSIFDIVTFLIMFYVMGWNHGGVNGITANYFQTGWFLVSLMTQSAVIIVFRSNKLPFYHTYPSMPVVLSLIIVSLIGFILVLVPGLQPIFSSLVQGNGLEFFGISFGIVGGYIISAQLAKMAYIKLFHHWL